jgi:NADH-quinone oxidoreductase subunit N
MVVGALTILYGNLCALPQRNLKRLLGYSSIAHAGYLLLGVALLSPEGTSAVLYYLSGYLFAVLAAFTVVCVALRALDNEDSSALAGLHHRSPVLAAALTGAMVSLAGVPPLAGFFGKFWILESVLAQAAAAPGTWWVLAAAIAGILLSLYYYFAVIRAVYWSPSPVDLGPLPVPKPLYWALCFCLAGLLWLGVFPNSIVVLVEQVVLTSFGS